MIKLISVISAILSVLLSCTPFAFPHNKDEIEHRYIVIQDAVYEKDIQFLKDTYGEINPDNEILYAMGYCGPMLLTFSPEVIAEEAENAFRLAVENNVPVWFQMDDVNNHYAAYVDEGVVSCDKWYENPLNTEKLGFGENAPSAPYWFNWGSWKKSPAMPCLNSPTFVEFIKKQLNTGFIPVLEKYLKILKEQNKEYLFAGVSVGWETRFPDYTDIPLDTVDQNGRKITAEERCRTGYRALENLGYTAEKLKSEAEDLGISEGLLMYRILCGVEHDYSEMISKIMFDAGVPRNKIFTHYTINSNLRTTDSNYSFHFPEVSAAVNDYSTPGYTVGINPSSKLICRLKMKIARTAPDLKYYGAVETYATDLNESRRTTLNYFNRLFNSGALVIAIYGNHDQPPSPFCFPHDRDAVFNRAVREILEK